MMLAELENILSNLADEIPKEDTIALLPQYMKDQGYTTHGLGKWHLGFCSQSYTPLRRGFDTYYGLFVGDDEEDIKKPRKPKTTTRKRKKKKKKKKKKVLSLIPLL